MKMGLFEPNFIPGLDRALLEIFLTLAAVGLVFLVLTISSIAGIIRALRRRRRGGRSSGAVRFSVVAVSITTLWLLYWVGDNLYHKSNPLDGLLVINLGLCVLPFVWLITAVRANGH